MSKELTPRKSDKKFLVALAHGYVELEQELNNRPIHPNPRYRVGLTYWTYQLDKIILNESSGMYTIIWKLVGDK